MKEQRAALEFRFLNREEVRMGSPYNTCRVRLSGDWVPDLPADDWQDLAAWREDHGALALVRWHTPGNRPGFRVWVLDPARRTAWTSDPVEGACIGLAWQGPSQIRWRTSLDTQGVIDAPL